MRHRLLQIVGLRFKLVGRVGIQSSLLISESRTAFRIIRQYGHSLQWITLASCTLVIRPAVQKRAMLVSPEDQSRVDSEPSQQLSGLSPPLEHVLLVPSTNVLLTGSAWKVPQQGATTRFRRGRLREQRSIADIAIHPHVLFNSDRSMAAFLIPGLVAVLMQMVTTLITAISIVRERENGTLDQILVTAAGHGVNHHIERVRSENIWLAMRHTDEISRLVNTLGETALADILHSRVRICVRLGEPNYFSPNCESLVVNAIGSLPPADIASPILPAIYGRNSSLFPTSESRRSRPDKSSPALTPLTAPFLQRTLGRG